MSQDKLYYVQYTGNDVVVLGSAGKFMPGTSAYLREADARAAAARGDFVVHGLEKSSDAGASSPAASSSSSATSTPSAPAPTPAAAAPVAPPAPSLANTSARAASSSPAPVKPEESKKEGAPKGDELKDVKDTKKEAAPKSEKQEAKQS